MLEKNLAQISRYNSDLANRIRGHRIAGSCAFDLAASGDIILYYENIPFHSQENPQQEALTIFNSLSDTSKKVITVVFGLGLGYLFKRVYLSSEARVVIYEPNLDILRTTLENVDFSQEFADERVMLITQKDDVKSAFTKYYLQSDPINVCFLPVYKQLFPDLLDEIANELGFLKGYFDNNYLTLFESSKEWLEMSLLNVPEILNSTYVDSLKGKFKGIPAVVVSAGPSLLNNIEQLKEIEDRVVIFSIGASLRLVKEEYNIQPDFSVFIDVSERTEPQIEGVTGIDSLNFIVQPYTYKKFFELESKRKFVYLPSNDLFSQWFSKKLKLDISHYYNKGTVAIAGVYNAINFGCDPIILMGQDLAFTKDGRTYADNRLSGHYEKDERYVKGWDGEMLPTNTSFTMFKRYFEEIAKDYKGRVKIINCSEGGAVIEGMEHISLRDVFSLIPENKINVEEIIASSETNYINPLKAGKLNIINSLRDTNNSLIKLIAFIKNSKILLNKIEKEIEKPDTNSKKLIKSFRQVYENNGRMDRIINNDCPLFVSYIQKESFAFKQEYNRYKNMNSIEDMRVYLELTKSYYEAILERAPDLSRVLDEILKVKKS